MDNWYRESETLANLEALLPPIAALIGGATLLGIAIFVIRYFISPDDPREKLAALKRNLFHVTCIGVGCALLAAGTSGATWVAATTDFFQNNGGMRDIITDAQAPGGNQFSPTNDSWLVGPAGSLSNNGYDASDPGSSWNKAMAAADADALDGNVGADWPRVWIALGEAGSDGPFGDARILTEEEVRADADLVAELEELGIHDLSDPVLYDDSGAYMRKNAVWWRQVLGQAGYDW